MKVKIKQDYRRRRHQRLRQKLSGTPDRPRMSVCLTHRHCYVQFVDDLAGATVVAVSTDAGELKPLAGRITMAAAKQVGAAAAAAAKAKGIETVVFDRGGFAYAGRIKALAEAAREAGLKF